MGYQIGEPLKPCPFCGSHALWWDDERLVHSKGDQLQLVFGIKCSREGCILDSRSKFYLTETAAGEAWNTRIKKEDNDG